MTTTTPGSTGIDVTELRRAVETADAESHLALYAPDAELTIVDRDHPPSAPTVLHCTDEIGGLLRDVAGRGMTHEVHDLIAGPDRLAFTEHCRYPDGTRVLCATVAQVHNGRIVRQVAVQAWDA